jgi:hypothetical protein
MKRKVKSAKVDPEPKPQFLKQTTKLRQGVNEHIFTKLSSKKIIGQKIQMSQLPDSALQSEAFMSDGPPLDTPSSGSVSANSVQQPVQTSAAVEEQVEYNPFVDLDPLEKIQIEYEMSSRKITPFDTDHYIQSMFSPNGTNDEMITVQLFEPIIKHVTDQDDKESRKKTKVHPTCHNNHLLANFVKEHDDQTACSFCQELFKKDDWVFACHHKCQFWLCSSCNLKYFKREKLKSQTSEHWFCENFDLEPVDEKLRDDEDG